MKLKCGILKVLVFLAIVLMISACVTGPEPVGEEPPIDRPAEQEPDWVSKYPVDPNYFIGIGSSSTGDRGDDMDRARLDALAALSSSIVTKIEAEIVIESTDDSEGNSYEQITQRIKENVNQDLKGVEPVDSYYSEKDGYWFYFRFPKAKLEEMKEDLTRRVLDMVSSSIESGYASIAEGLALLWDGYELIQESAFVGTIQADVGDYTGALIDILQKEVSKLSASLTMKVRPEELRIEQGQTPEVVLELSNSLGIPTGQFHVLLISETREVVDIVTDREGMYGGKVDLAALDMGRSVGSWIVDFSALGINTDLVRLFRPEVSVLTEVSKKSIGLKAETGTGESFQGLYQSVSSLFSKSIPFEIADTYDPSRTNILFTLHFRDLPENDFGLFFTFARAVVSVEQAGKTIFSYESEEYKEGGITIQQARERAKAELFEILTNESKLFRDIISTVTAK